MNVNKVIKEIEVLISLFEELISQENFKAYIRLKYKYLEVLSNVRDKEESRITENDFKEIQSAFRIILEAPPRNKEIGIKILNQMEAIYQIQKDILDD